LPSVPPLVKTSWSGATPANSANDARADATAKAGRRARMCGLDGLPKSARKYGSIAATASGTTAVVALLSK